MSVRFSPLAPCSTPLDADSDPTGFEGFHRLIGESPAVRSRLRALWDETEDALTTPPGPAQ